MTAVPALDAYAVTLPVAPSSNRYWRVWRNRAVRTKEAEAYIAAVRQAVGPLRVLFVGPVAVTIHWYRAARMGDLDGRLKVVLDAFQGCVYENDRQIVELHAYRHEDPKAPRMELTVESRA
jgi:crossover junction endodeoxyribonuclease RusA